MPITVDSARFNWQPENSEITLATHQQAAIQRCFEIEKDYNTIILRDPPGAGKTFIILGYIRAIKENKNPTYTTIDFSEFALSSNVILNDINNLNLKDISINIYPQHIKDKLDTYNALLEQDTEQLKYKELELQIELDELSNVLNNNNINLKLNELENIKNRIRIIRDTIKNLSSYDIKDYKSTSINAIRANKIINHSITLIVVPYNIHTQWMEEIKRFGGLTYYSYCDFEDITKLYFNPSAYIFDYDILITNAIYYDLISSISNQLGIIFDRIIIDEVDNIINYVNVIFGKTSTFSITTLKKCDEIKSIKKWYVSASIDLSPKSLFTHNNGILIMNHHNSLFYIPSSNISDIEKYDIITTSEFIAESFIIPPYLERIYILTNNIIDNILVQILDKAQMSKLNAHDYSSLKFKYNIEIGNSLTEIAKIIKKDLITGIEITNNQITNLTKINPNDSTSIELYTNTLKELTNKLANFESRITENNICPICFNELTSKVIMRCCNHTFCEYCIFKLVENHNVGNCAMCRAQFKISDIIILNNTTEIMQPHNGDDYFSIGEHHLGYSTFTNDKLNILDKLLKHIMFRSSSIIKIMIFSISAFKIMEYIKSNIQNIEIDILGMNNETDINNIVKKYKFGNLSVLLIDPLMYGSGMNFENTSDLIIMHSVDNIEQIIGRAQRYGRIAPLNIWKILYENEK